MDRMELAALIDDVEARNGWSDGDVCRRAVERGHMLSGSDVSDYRRKGISAIKPAKVKALAAGLGVPPHVVVRAVMADRGIEMPEPTTGPEEAVERDYTLSEYLREILLLLIRNERDR